MGLFVREKRSELMYSGLILDEEGIILDKIKELPKHIGEKILELPQYEIFFEGYKAFYRDSKSGDVKELPKRNGNGFYYDPVENTEAYKLVIGEVKSIAENEYKQQMLEVFGTTRVFGGVHTLYNKEARILYDKYGITWINNPMRLNRGLCID